ncbi:mechanosensitive ion channel domain-containing protein [Thiococcus pfennigii]|uniref:mechanosensitive ion channel domain-containing protein n=1 Tax=Thiococcus pfennigii TaxID=1057 RepID=UPI0030B8E19A
MRRSSSKLTRARWRWPFAALLLAWLAGAALLGVFASVALAAPQDSVTLTARPDAGVSVAQIESKIKEVESATDLDDATKAKVQELLQRAISNLQVADDHEAKAQAYAEALTMAPAETARIRKEIAAAEAATPKPVPATLSLAEIEQRLTQTQVEVSLTETKLNEADKVLDDRTQRLERARQRITEARRSLEELGTELGQPAVEGEPPALAQARRWAQQTNQQALWSEVRMLEQDLVSADVRAERLKAQRDQAAGRLERLRAQQRSLEELRNERRRAEAERAEAEAKAAEAQAADADPRVQELTRANAALGQALTALTADLDALGKTAEELRGQAERIEAEYQGARQRIQIAGVNEAFGQLLLDRRKQLPDLRVVRQQLTARQGALTDSMLRQLRYQEERRRFQGRDAYLDEQTAAVEPDQRIEVRRQLREAATRRVELLDQALRLEETYQRALGELNFATSELLATAARYDDFLAEHLLWVRSAAPVGLATLKALPAAAAWLVGPSGWSEVARVLAHEARTSSLFWLLVMAVALLIWRQRAIRTALRATAEPLRRVRTDSFLHTAKGLALTLLLAAPWPLLMAGLGWRLADSAQSTVFTSSLGVSAISLAAGVYYLRAFRALCIARGVADRHFRWSGEILLRLRRNLDWLTAVLIPLGLVVLLLYNQTNESYSASLGRLALIALMLAFAVFFARLLHPSGGVLKQFLANHPAGWASRLRYVWYPLIQAVPLGLVVLAVLGFVYTAGTLLNAMVSQLWLALGLVVLHQSIVRWLIVTRRHLALKAALERQAARRAEAERSSEETGGGSTLQYEEPEADLASLDEQTRNLINTLVFFAAASGLWLIWRDLLPALGVFDRIALWHYAAVIDGADQIKPFTLVDLGIVLVVCFIAFAAARHLPALIEILLLKQTKITAGSRYAITTLIGYGIFAVAILLVFSALGLSWSQAQWLIAALGVGIGFGLQEIVANFISGLIILFERPVRVGDIVTIGDTTGVVTKIRIRATTIRNWDRQELLVPNKEFITGRLLNWTLTDQTTRLTLPVGVAYGSDTRKALALLAEAAREHPQVLADPAPLITFESFGDNALTLVLRCYLASLENRLAVTTDLHQAINDKFAEAGIEIAYPQRDVHLFANQPLDVRLHRAGSKPAAED